MSRVETPTPNGVTFFQRRCAYNVLAVVTKENTVPKFSRRTFVKQAGMCLALSEFLLWGEKMGHADPLGLPIGCQTWPVRKMMRIILLSVSSRINLTMSSPA